MTKDGRVGSAETGSREPSPNGLGPTGFDPARDSIWFGPVQDDESEAIEDLLTGNVICGQCGATLQTYSSKCSVPPAAPCVGFLAVEGARLHRRRRLAIAMEAHQGTDPKGLDGEAATARAEGIAQ